MNKLLKRLKRREGFTLVECIVAVAVFAVMVMLVGVRGVAQRSQK